MPTSLPLPPVLCLVKPIALVCTLKMAKELCLLGHVVNLLSLTFILSLYLAYRGQWLDPGYRIPGVWASGPKLFSEQHSLACDLLGIQSIGLSLYPLPPHSCPDGLFPFRNANLPGSHREGVQGNM